MTQKVGFSDIYFAAALMSYGVAIEDIDRSDTRRQKFIFSVPPQSVVITENDVEVKAVRGLSLEEVERLFVMRQLYLPPGYPDSLRSIKTMVHSSYDS